MLETHTALVAEEHWRTVIVAERIDVALGVIALVFKEPEGREFAAWAPGAHIDMLLQDGKLVRQYSLCGDPNDLRRWKIAVLDAPGGRGGSRHIHASIRVGDKVEVRGPRNHFPLRSSSRYIFIAGGIGITPILPMIAAAKAAGANWQLHYGGRSRSSMAFLDKFTTNSEQVFIWPEDEKGLLPLIKILDCPADDVLVYCCGPEGLLSAIEEATASWPAGSLHVERFAPKNPAILSDGDIAFEIECRRSGVTLLVPPDRSTLEVLEEADIDVLFGCRDGICGTCETRVLEGVPDHRDSVFTDDERAKNASMIVCVSRGKGRLLLDL